LAIFGDDYRYTYFRVNYDLENQSSVIQIEADVDERTAFADKVNLFLPLDSLILQTAFVGRSNSQLIAIGTSTGLVEIASIDGKNKTSLKHDLPIACLQFFDHADKSYLFVGPAIGSPCIYGVAKTNQDENKSPFKFDNYSFCRAATTCFCVITVCSPTTTTIICFWRWDILKI